MDMNAKDDECNFDELEAMLNDSDDEAIMEEASAMAANTKQEDAESSDDDIDDDELDRLAMLVESGEAGEPETQDSSKPVIKVEKEDEKQGLQEGKPEPKLPEVKAEQVSDVKSGHQKLSSPSQNVEADNSVSDDEEARALEDEMRKMKARLKEREIKKLRLKIQELEEEVRKELSAPLEDDSSDDEEGQALKDEMRKMKARLKELEIKKLRTKLQELEAEEPTSPSSKPSSSPPSKMALSSSTKTSSSVSSKSSSSSSNKTSSSLTKSSSSSSSKTSSSKTSVSPSSKSSTSLSSKIAASISASIKSSTSAKHETTKRVLDAKVNSPKSSGKIETSRPAPALSSPGGVKRENGKTVGSKPTVATPNRTGTPNRSATPGKGGSGDKAKSTGPPRILKDLEVDLFGAESSSLESPASKNVKPNSQNEKPNLQNLKSGASQAIKVKPVNNSQRDTAARNERAAGVEEDEYDWDMEGEGGSLLSAEGKEIEKSLKVQTNRGQRTAHQASYDMNAINNRKATWGSSPWRAASSSAMTQQIKKVEEDVNVTRDPFSGIRMVDPLVSSTQMKTRMENRRLVKLSSIHQKARASLEGDWVTIGVLVYKSDPKTSQKGNAFSIWTLTDLQDCNHPVKMFLFGETHKAHWKTSVGVVVGILNPSLMQNNEKYQKTDEVCITTDHPQKLMLMGKSKDLAFCKGTTKAGKKCIQFINSQQGEYCQFHVQKAYKNVSAKRAELQSGHTGSMPKSFEQRLMGKGHNKNQFFYGGKSFSTGVATKPDKKASLQSLVHHDARAPGKVTTLALHPLLPEDKQKMKEADAARLARLESEKNKAFHDMLTTPTVGAVNLVKHLAKQESTQEQRTQEKKPVQHVRAKDLLLQHKRDLDQRRLQYKQKQEQRQRGSSGPMIDLDEPMAPAPQTANPLQCVPQLGRGFSSSPLSAKNLNHAALDKIKAAHLIKTRGGIKKEDPNAIRKKSTDESRENVMKRLIEDTEKNESSSSGGEEPPKKKSRLLGGLDLDDPEVKKLLKSKSKHAHKLTEMEEEKQAAYFDTLEKKEAMEEKMASITKIKAKAVTCRNCKYSALSAKPECKQQGHDMVWFDSYKRFFHCKDCKRRTVSIDRVPIHPCQGCGSNDWVKTSMMKEKKVTLPSEELLLRGEERKFINS